MLPTSRRARASSLSFLRPLTPKRPRRLSRWQSFLLYTLLLPCLLMGGGSGAFYLQMHREALDQSVAHLPVAPRPADKQRLLVLAPHCDDETLGLGALIADARRKGVPVTVAFLTNGDGFRIAAGRDLREVEVSPVDLIRFAERRQKESLRALEQLGVPAENVIFLGYPDRGLKPMWEQNWRPNDLFRSSFTGHTHSPYPRCYTVRTPYCGEAVLSDLVRLIRTTRPTDIYVTHPADDHPDHSTAASFTQAAVQEIQEQAGASSVASARLHYYIVHRGDWPLPQGLHPDQPLPPPPGLAQSDTVWTAYMPSQAARVAKAHALERYKSQLGVSRRFLVSFLRANELISTLPEPEVPPAGGPAHVRDATQDTVARYISPAADLTGITVQERGASLHVRLFTRGPVSSSVRYTLLLKSRRPGGGDAFSALKLSVPSSKKGNALEVTIPREKLGPATDCLWVSAETRWMGATSLKMLPPVDRIGYRPFRFGGAASRSTVALNSAPSSTP